MTFCTCQQSLPEGWAPDTLEKEVRAATLRLGIQPDRVTVHDFEVRRLDSQRQEVLETLIRLRADVDPDLILLPCLQDMHQDHAVIAAEGIRAFKRCTVMAYELPWNNLTFSTQGFVALEERHIRRKLDALKCYASQRHRPYADPSFIRGLARTRGVESGHRYAEAFQIIRMNIGPAAMPLAKGPSSRGAAEHPHPQPSPQTC